MHKTKKWLIAATLLILIGCIILGGATIISKWDFTKLSTTKYITNGYTITEDFQNISITTDTADIVFVTSQDASTSVTCFEEENVKHDVSVKGGTLTITVNDTRKWYEHIGINFRSPKITVHLPRGEHGALGITSSTGDLVIPKDFQFESMDITEDTGDAAISSSVSKAMNIKTNTGDISVENVFADTMQLSVSTGDITVGSVTCHGDIKIHVSTGKTRITDTKCENLISDGNTGDVSLNNVIATGKYDIERSTGDIRFAKCDAGEIYIQTDTGDVKGSLLTGKIFIVNTDTGKISVPKTTTGGKCEITTNTGDVKLNLP